MAFKQTIEDVVTKNTVVLYFNPNKTEYEFQKMHQKNRSKKAVNTDTV